MAQEETKFRFTFYLPHLPPAGSIALSNLAISFSTHGSFKFDFGYPSNVDGKAFTVGTGIWAGRGYFALQATPKNFHKLLRPPLKSPFLHTVNPNNIKLSLSVICPVTSSVSAATSLAQTPSFLQDKPNPPST